MKKLILISIVAVLFSCKKEKTGSEIISQTTNVNQPTPIYTVAKGSVIKIKVGSNYKFPFVAIENGQTTIERFNHVNLVSPVEISYTFTASTPGKYRVNTYSIKNGQDSTKHITDGNVLFNSLIVISGQDTVYSHIDLASDKTDFHPSGSKHASNSVYFMVN